VSSQTAYPPGLNLPAKYPFWSAIMLLNTGSVSISSGSTVYVDIQPASNETWFAFIQAFQSVTTSVNNQPVYIYVNKYDGNTLSQIGGDYGQVNANYGFYRLPSININAILSNSLWVRLSFYQTGTGVTGTGYYGYSGFKLSKPLWKTIPAVDPKPFKQKASSQLPDVLTPLSDFAVDIYDPSINDYKTSIILEEDTPIALDPNTQFPVERLSAYVSVDDLVNIINGIKKGTFDPVKSGWKKYLDKWNSLGIKVV